MIGIMQNHQSYRDRPLGRGRSSALAGHNQLPRSRNCRDAAPLDVMSFSGKGSQELQSQAPASQLPVFGVNGRGKSSPTDLISYGHMVGRGLSHTNGYALPTERLEFGSLGSVQLVGAASSEQGGLLDSGAFHHKHGSGSVLPMTVPRPGPNLNRERYDVCKKFSYAHFIWQWKVTIYLFISIEHTPHCGYTSYQGRPLDQNAYPQISCRLE